eukprot:GFUD01004886.1.p1 GENE.GFUD01004886.1~~GFUD01004886.1.p1  ORF type:complete len:133 (+),score=15.89 GFUD01004886.1:282-680(+)
MTAPRYLLVSVALMFLCLGSTWSTCFHTKCPAAPPPLQATLPFLSSEEGGPLHLVVRVVVLLVDLSLATLSMTNFVKGPFPFSAIKGVLLNIMKNVYNGANKYQYRVIQWNRNNKIVFKFLSTASSFLPQDY